LTERPDDTDGGRGGDAGRVLGDIGTNVIYEDDKVRVWRLKLGPGEESPVHRHELDHLLVQVSGDRIAVIPEPDTQGPFTEMLEADVVPGAVVHVHHGGVERARNVGSLPYLEVIVELKESAAPEAGRSLG
jgi:predicted metal-dependent enzyme (double-stranded beta helix superfamily)